MTYNVHSCVGNDGQLSVERVAEVIRALAPDVVALQEVDVKQHRSGRVDQSERLAARLGMNHLFSSARDTDGGHYGNAILSRYPLTTVRDERLPARAGGRLLEPRAAQRVRIDVGSQEVHLMNTHLSLDRHERRHQVEALLGSSWIRHPDFAAPLMICGDFNSTPWSGVYRAMSRHLQDARPGWLTRFRATFPSFLPILTLDYVFTSPGVYVRGTKVPWTRETRLASDHLPLMVDVSL